MFRRVSYAETFVIVTLQPFIRQMEEGAKDISVEVPLENLYRQMECWRYDFSSLPRRSEIFGYDPGMPEEETKEVYAVMDTAFRELFPDMIGYSRDEAAVFMEQRVSSVFREVRRGEPALPDHKEQLIAFVKKVVEALKSKAESSITSESAA